MAESLVSFAVETTITTLVSAIANEVKLIRGLEGDLRTMSDKLKTILNLLKDAEKRQEKGETMKSWIQKLKNAAYDAENVWDEYAFEMLRRKLEIQKRVKARKFFSVSTNPIMFSDRMARKVKDANMMLSGVVNEGNELGLNQALQQVSPRIHTEVPDVHSFLGESNILGREADASKVVDMLLQSESDQNLSVISVVGLGGLGKTTLTQLVYKDQNVTNHFNRLMWVCVSDDFNVPRILKEMLANFKPHVGETSNIEGLIKELEKELRGKKYLLVLDDVWNTVRAKWESLRNSLLGIGATKESRILVTTRNVEVTLTMTETHLTHHLPILSDEDSWSLFRQRAFATGGAANETPYLVAVGKEMSKRCGGVPLALKALGAMMHSKEATEWPSIGESFLWNDYERDVMHTLELSFNNLPSPSLKQCFVYSSIFPKDFIFEKDDLVQLWIAQGFIPTSEGGSNNKHMEDTGNAYFKILWWNSFFQDVEMDKYGNIKTCKMHDLMHDLAQVLSKSECLMLDASDQNVSIEIRHLALAENREIMPVIVEENATKLRTFFPANARCEDILLKFQFLHTLKLVGINITELPATIGKLKQLRYLDVSKTEIEVYPACIAKLYNLQTLRLTNLQKSVELLEKFNTLIRLRHLYFDSEAMSLMPIAMGQLTCLQTLSCFVVGVDQGRRISELGSLSNLGGKIDIRNLEFVSNKHEAEKANLKIKTKVYKLKLAWSSERGEGDDNNDEDVLEGLQPPPNLKSLTIEHFLGCNFPSWMMISNLNYSGNSQLPQSLVSLKLIGCSNCEQIPTLGELPFLQFLEIDGMVNVKSIGKEFYSYSSRGDGGTKNRTLFPKLKSLGFRNMHNLVEWSEAAVAATTSTTSSSSERGGTIVVFPCLEELTIYKCERLQMAPSHFPSLRKLSIDGIESGAPIVNIGSKMSTLTHLYVRNIPELGLLLQNNKDLTYLEMDDCEMLMISPDGLRNLVSLESLRIDGCRNLTLSMVSIQGLTSLKELKIYSCDGMTSLPIGLGSCASLEKLEVVGCANLVSVAEEDLRELKSVSSLIIRGCVNLKSILFERFLHCLPRLQSLQIGRFLEELESFPFTINVDYIQQLPQLQSLHLRGWPKLKSLPDQIQHFTTLHALYLIGFDELEVLPDWLGDLSSLKCLGIYYCGNLKSLPSVTSIQRLSNLQEVDIYGSLFWRIDAWGTVQRRSKFPILQKFPYTDQIFTSLNQRAALLGLNQ